MCVSVSDLEPKAMRQHLSDTMENGKGGRTEMTVIEQEKA